MHVNPPFSSYSVLAPRFQSFLHTVFLSLDFFGGVCLLGNSIVVVNKYLKAAEGIRDQI